MAEGHDGRDASMKALGLNWQIGSNYGWGTYGMELALHLLRRGGPMPVLLQPAAELRADELRFARLQQVIRASAAVLEGRGRIDPRARGNGLVVAHALGNNAEPAFAPNRIAVAAEREVALTFIENTACSDWARRRFASFPLVVAGSAWCRDMLAAQGASDPTVCIQGIDPTVFHPAPRLGEFRNRFTIFSGGKLEFRKGQDIVLAACKAFRSRHPETLLVSVWGNAWTRSRGLAQFRHSPHVSGPPATSPERGIDWNGWMTELDVGMNDITMFGFFTHDRLPLLMREADVALFPNRAEGGTNLVAMEAMACGVPTILSANTGHLDIIADGACIPLRDQRPVAADEPGLGTEGWGESDIDEIVEALERVWQDREAARAIGAAGAAHMARFAWAAQLDRLLGLIEGLG